MRMSVGILAIICQLTNLICLCFVPQKYTADSAKGKRLIFIGMAVQVIAIIALIYLFLTR